MFNRSDKRRLYWLMDQYLSGEIIERVFCDEYYYAYDLEIDDYTLTDLEHMLFSELSTVAGRYSEYEKDHKLAPNAFYTIEELRKMITDTKDKLKWER